MKTDPSPAHPRIGRNSPRTRARGLLRWTLALVSTPLVLGGIGLLGLFWYLHTAAERSMLSSSEWERLRGRLFRSAAARGPTESAPPPLGAAPAPAQSPTAAPPQRPPSPPPNPEDLARQRREYEADVSKTVVELQPFRRKETLPLPDGVGVATLVNVNPTVNSWYLLELRGTKEGEGTYHLVNDRPKTQDLTLDPAHPDGVTLVDSLGRRPCPLWSDAAPVRLAMARLSRSPYVSLCGEEITLRLPTPGRRTTLEWATDFLRDNVSGGEAITIFIREKFFQDAFLETSEIVGANGGSSLPEEEANAPVAARMHPRYAHVLLAPGDLAISVNGPAGDELVAGGWYPARFQPGVYLSVVRPNLLAPEIFSEHRDVVSTLDEVEREALVYLVAFDLSQLELGFALGTEHPRVGWSERASPSARDPRLPGPDGIGDIVPLVATGIVPRSEAHRTIATFTGGFKRDHGAFRTSDLAIRNHGSHYGFIESGATLSRLQPDLATIFVLDDGRVDMKTWAAEDDAMLPRVVFARQNGLPIIERDPQTGEPVPGRRVSQWAAGNWSGSQDRKFRTVRAGAAVQTAGGRRFLVYAYFSSATPSGMARVFQAYGCEYAMLLDMNALEHTYLALYGVDEKSLSVEHLVRGMDVLDKTIEGQVIPRFLGFADNRDFFYVLRRRPLVEAPETNPETFTP